MKIIVAIKSGVFRTVKLWKGILIIWFTSLLLASMVALPLKGALKSGLGNSMITEKLADGINVEVLAELGATFTGLVSSFTAGLFITLLTGFLLNTFLMGGLFNGLKGSSGKFSASEFFLAATENFWSFLFISLIISIITLAALILIVVVPVSVVTNSEIPREGAAFKTFIWCLIAFFFVLSLLLLVADYARAWQVSERKNPGFRAIGFGFSQTFRKFKTSYPMMVIIVVIQLLFGWLVLDILPGMKPETGTGVFLLFLLSQFLFFIRIILKACRYGSVTALMEMNVPGQI
jgi:hypothetical protein